MTQLNKICIRNIKTIKRTKPNIEEIKIFLLSLFCCENYDEFLNRQKLGDCVRIACAVSKAFPRVKIFSCEVIDASGSLCTHYLNKLGNEYLDFSLGTLGYTVKIENIKYENLEEEHLKYVKYMC